MYVSELYSSKYILIFYFLQYLYALNSKIQKLLFRNFINCRSLKYFNIMFS